MQRTPSPRTSEKFHDFLSSLNILPHAIADKEHWAHGTAEAAVQDVKHTASAVHLESRDQDPAVSLQLAVSALNSTEYTAGFSSYQWAYGQHYSISDEDVRTYGNVEDNSKLDFVRLLGSRPRRLPGRPALRELCQSWQTRLCANPFDSFMTWSW